MNNIISVDWLSISCDVSELKMPPSFKSIKLDYSTRQFREVVQVMYRDKEFAVISMHPVSSIIDSKLGVIKFANHVLYLEFGMSMIQSFIAHSGVRDVKLSRLDIALDFVRMVKYHNIQDFFIDFLAGVILKSGRSVFSLAGTHNQLNVYNYIRFGKRSSDVCVYMYNKSQEMRDVKYKQHIAEKWTANGWDGKQDVWRLEISITSAGRTYIDNTDNSSHEITINDIADPSIVHYLFNIYAYKYFRFVSPNGQKNKSRMPIVNLLDIPKSSISIATDPKFPDFDRKEKQLVKALYLYESERRSVTAEEREAATTLFLAMTQDTGLEQYVISRIDYWK